MGGRGEEDWGYDVDTKLTSFTDYGNVRAIDFHFQDHFVVSLENIVFLHVNMV